MRQSPESPPWWPKFVVAMASLATIVMVVTAGQSLVALSGALTATAALVSSLGGTGGKSGTSP